MPRRCLVCCVIAIVPGSEVLTAFRIVSLDLHVGITKPHLDHGSLGTADIDSTLLLLAGRVERLVESDLLSLVFGHIKEWTPFLS